MKFEVITIFPEIIEAYVKQSILKRAVNKKLLKISAHNPRKYATDKHKTVDDRPYGGGPGMILMFEPIYKSLKNIKQAKKSRVIMLDPAGQQFTQRLAEKFVKYDQLILLAGRYEGFDARIEKFVDEKISVGPYVLAGGELPALTVIEATARLLPQVLGHPDSNKDETFANDLDYQEYPQYTRPEIVKTGKKKIAVPEILLSGNHKEIEKWRHKQAKKNKKIT